MKRSITTLLVGVLVLVGQACQDGPTTSPVSTDLDPSPAIQTFADGFYILPPVGSARSTDGFLGSLSPRVDVCQWNGTACDGGHLATFTTSDGTGGALIRVSSDSVYEVEWDTGTSAEQIDYDATYQIVVSLGGEPLGTADIRFFDNGKAKGSDDEFDLKDGRTLPIRFAVTLPALLDLIDLGEGEADRLTDDVVVQTFTTDGGTQTATVPSGDAAFRVDGENVQIPGDDDAFTLVIAEKELDPNGACEPVYGGPQSGECYVFETIPEGVTFFEESDPERPAGLAGVCPADDVTSGFALAKFDDGTTTFPPPAQTNIVSCDEVALDRLPGFVRGLAQLFLPRPLHATDTGETGLVGNFSTLFWAVPLAVQEDPGDPWPAGSFLPEQSTTLSFRVVGQHDPSEVVPDGVEVGFSATGGTASPSTATTSGGTVQVDWTVPATADDYTLTAAVPGTGAETTFAASVSEDLTLLASCPTGSGGDRITRGFYVGSYPGTALTGVDLFISSDVQGDFRFSLTARADDYDGTVLGTAISEFVTLSGSRSDNVPTRFTYPGGIALDQGSTVTFEIGVVDAPAGADETTTFYDVGSFPLDGTDSDACPATETEGTSPGLDTIRRGGIAINLFGL